MDKHKRNIAGLILAAGEGRRIGKTKSLLEINGVSFLQMVADNLKRSGCVTITVVCGSDADEVRKEARQIPIDCIFNKNWQLGQYSSLRAGLKSLSQDISGVLVTLVDHPFVLPETYKKLMDAFVKSPHSIVKPVYDSRSGHPIVIPQDIIDEIKQSSDKLTLRDVLSKYEDRIMRITVDDPGILKDIDTLQDLEKAKSDERCR